MGPQRGVAAERPVADVAMERLVHVVLLVLGAADEDDAAAVALGALGHAGHAPALDRVVVLHHADGNGVLRAERVRILLRGLRAGGLLELDGARVRSRHDEDLRLDRLGGETRLAFDLHHGALLVRVLRQRGAASFAVLDLQRVLRLLLRLGLLDLLLTGLLALLLRMRLHLVRLEVALGVERHAALVAREAYPVRGHDLDLGLLRLLLHLHGYLLRLLQFFGYIQFLIGRWGKLGSFTLNCRNLVRSANYFKLKSLSVCTENSIFEDSFK